MFLNMDMWGEFQLLFLDAVMADLWSGDTIRHALNLGILGKQEQD